MAETCRNIEFWTKIWSIFTLEFLFIYFHRSSCLFIRDYFYTYLRLFSCYCLDGIGPANLANLARPIRPTLALLSYYCVEK